MSTTPLLSPEQFGQKIKDKHPDYADIPNEQLAHMVLVKHPEYSDMVNIAPGSRFMVDQNGQNGRFIDPPHLAQAGRQGWNDVGPTQFEQANSKRVGFGEMVNNAMDKVGGIVTSIPAQAKTMRAIISPFSSAKDKGSAMADAAMPGIQGAAATPANASRVERGAMIVAPYVGTDPKKLAESAQRGDAMGMIDATSGTWAPMAAGKLAGATAGAMSDVPKSMSPSVAVGDIASKLQTGNIANARPAMGQYPPRVVNAAENIFRSAAPTNMNKGFRSNLEASIPDLADIGRKIDLSETKGGIMSPDMRVGATVDALRQHLQEMYATERAPQIQRNANTPVSVGGSADSARGLEYLESTAGTEQIRTLASKAIKGKQLTMSEADMLAQAANQNLKTFERMTPEGKVQASITSPKIGGLKALDSELGRNLNDVLQANGETGLRDYERRYAGLSAIRDQLESRVNASQLERQGVGKYVRLLTGGKAGVASASQAAVADVNMGMRLQRAFKDLAASELTAKKP